MSSTFADAQTILRQAIQSRGLPPIQAAVLEVLALEDYGLQQSAAASILAPAVNRTTEECSDALMALLGEGLALSIHVDTHDRIVANYQKLGISEDVRQAIRLAHPTPFEVLDAPHSEEAMATLHRMFLEEAHPIYLGLEMTSHKVFQKLEERALSGRMTEFVMPHRKRIVAERQKHYDETLVAWKSFLRELKPAARRNIRLRVTRMPCRYVYTSALTRDFVRFNCYWYEQGTTRRGVMVRAEKGSSLYDMVHREFAVLIEQSAPLFSIWPKEWIRAKLYQHLMITAGIIALAIAFTLERTYGKTTEVFVAFLVGIAGESLWMFLRSHHRAPSGLFAN